MSQIMQIVRFGVRIEIVYTLHIVYNLHIVYTRHIVYNLYTIPLQNIK